MASKKKKTKVKKNGKAKKAKKTKKIKKLKKTKKINKPKKVKVAAKKKSVNKKSAKPAKTTKSVAAKPVQKTFEKKVATQSVMVPKATQATPAVPAKPAWTTPAWGESEVGIVEHFFAEINVAAIKLKKPLKVGDKLHFRGHTTDFVQLVDSMQIEHQPVAEAPGDSDIGIKVKDRVREHDIVYRVAK